MADNSAGTVNDDTSGHPAIIRDGELISDATVRVSPPRDDDRVTHGGERVSPCMLRMSRFF